MARRARRIVGVLCSVAIVSTAANAQVAQTIAAPVPSQILLAKRMFIANAGSETYGSETYFRLTRYDGGPDRFYNQFYAAMKAWGRYELTGSPAEADVVGEVRFSSPVVEQNAVVLGDRSASDPVYDPQLNLTLLDPKSRVPLWSLTEHIQPGRGKDANNRNFDQAVTRLVERAKLLASSSIDVTRVADAPPVGAVEAARKQAQASHAAIGALVGVGVGALIMAGAGRCGDPVDCTSSRTKASVTRGLQLSLGTVAVGAAIGWFWPTRF
jgi:hypothetical protein